MEKLKTRKLNDNCYLLGTRKEDGKKVYLVEPSWDCGWYWGFGYVRTYTTRDIYDHLHFNGLFLNENIFDSFKNYFEETTLNDEEIWQLLGYMKEFYLMQKYAELLQYGNHITSKAKNILEEKNKEQNKKEVERINKLLMPELFEKIDNLLTKKAPLSGCEFWQCKNKYGYIIKQLKINYDNKTFSVGSFRIGADKTTTSKAISEKIDELKKIGFVEV